MKNRILLAASAMLLLALAGCGEEQAAVQDSEPPAAEQEATPGETAPQKDTATELREAAEALSQEAGRVAEDLRQTAEQALEDAGPALEKAGEIAGQFRDSVDEIIARAASDLERAADALEKQIAESGEPAASDGDPAASLPPADSLNADTRAAARARPAGVGPDYVGVWAGDAASCARIDQEAVEIFAVITPTTIRRHESVCNIEPAPLADGKATLDATCIAEGAEEERQVVLTMSSPDALNISYGEGAGGADLVRCHLPE